MILFIVLFLLVSVELCTPTNPGVKVRVSRRGIDYASEVAAGEIVRLLNSGRFSSMSTRSGRTSFNLRNIYVERVVPPSSSTRMVPTLTGASWSLSGFSVTVRANYRARYKRGWFSIRNSGWIRASVNRVSMTETVSFDTDYAGRPSVRHGHCYNHIGDVGVRFHGSWSWLINLFRGWIGNKFKASLRSKLCSEAARVINGMAAPTLARMNMEADLARHFTFDYRLVGRPVITSDYIETWNKGEVFSKYNSRAAPFSRQTIPEWGYGGHMVHIWMTEYSFNTLLYQAHTNNHLKYTATQADFSSLFDTTCSDEDCVGSMIPLIAEDYPNSTLEVSLQSATVPTAILTTGSFSVNLTTLANVRIRDSNNDVFDLASFNLDVSMTFRPRIVNQKLTGEITDYSLALSYVIFDNGEVLDTPPMVDDVVTRVFGERVIPRLNLHAARGVDLPVIGKIRFTNTFVNVEQGYLVVGTDVQKTWY